MPMSSAELRAQATKLNLCVAVPMYNEESGAARCVEEIGKALLALPHRTMLLIVDDGSTDRTSEILYGLRVAWPLLSIRSHERNGGYGRAVQTAFQEAAAWGADYVLVMDSDLTNDPRYIPAFVERMRSGYDVIKASRYVAGGRVEGVPLRRIVVSRVGNWLVRRLVGLPLLDYTNGFRALRMDVARKMRLSEPGFAVILEEMYFAKFVATSFCEIPYTLTNRSKERGRSHFRYRPHVFLNYLKYPIKAFLGIRPDPSVSKGKECATW